MSVHSSRVGAIEKRHEERYNRLLENVKGDAVFVKKDKNRWECRNCCLIIEGEKAPEKCPVCRVAKGHFEIEAINY